MQDFQSGNKFWDNIAENPVELAGRPYKLVIPWPKYN